MVELPFALIGTVIAGKRLGSRLGFPTANIAYEASLRIWPSEGVYVGVAQVEGDARRYLAILNQGKHPTAPSGVPTVEAHLLGFPYQPLYGKRLSLHYRFFLRREQAFPSLDELAEQLGQDKKAAVSWAKTNEPELFKALDAAKGE